MHRLPEQYLRVFLCAEWAGSRLRPSDHRFRPRYIRGRLRGREYLKDEQSVGYLLRLAAGFVDRDVKRAPVKCCSQYNVVESRFADSIGNSGRLRGDIGDRRYE